MSEKIRKPVLLRRLQLADIPEALRMSEEAHRNDPLQRYLRNTPDARYSWFRTEWHMALGFRMARHIRRGNLFTLGDVDGTVWYVRPSQDDDDNLDKVASSVMPIVSQRLLSKIQKRRQAAFRKLFSETLDRSLGRRRKEMIELGGLATRPSKQGLGYGSALVKAVTDIADAEGRAIWLGSSNVENTRFYESHGFSTIATVTLGEADPTWNEPPVVLKLMIRDPCRGAARHQR